MAIPTRALSISFRFEMLGMLVRRLSARLNKVTRVSEIVPEDGTGLLVCDLIQDRDLIYATDDDIRHTLKRLQDHSATDDRKTFASRQQAYGWRYEPSCLLYDEALNDTMKPATQTAIDWMHCFMVSGVFSTILFCLLEDVTKEGPHIFLQNVLI